MPEGMCTLIVEYYSDVNLRFSTREITTEWQNLEKVLISWLILSAILFALSINILLPEVKRETKRAKANSGQ